MEALTTVHPLTHKVSDALITFTQWLEHYGESSFDHQTFFAGRIGAAAKSLYYRRRALGTLAVAPMVFLEACWPSARRFFHCKIRFPIADAHYAMGYSFLGELTGNHEYLQRAAHFLDVLTVSRCNQFREYCWGYPFDWVTRNGIIKRQTPLITTTPYVYEAFLQLYATDPRPEWRTVLASVAKHAYTDIKTFPTSVAASSCSYSPFDGGGVINAAAYRAFLLTSASKVFSDDRYWATAERNLNFVLEAQNPDGSWFYAVDGVRDFVDHFHTCFVLKALAKIYALTGHKGCLAALGRGVRYYLDNLFDEEGLPKPFARAPRLTVYKRELYDCAECINVCLLLRHEFPRLNQTLEVVVAEIVNHWIKPDGSFRSRQLLFGWDNVPMHRWAQSQMFRSLALFLRESSR